MSIKKLMVTLVMATVFCLAGVTASAQQNDDTANAQLRLAHTSLDAGPVDIYLDDVAVLTEFEFGTVSDWLTLPAGTYSTAVVPTEGALEDAVLGPLDLELAGDTWSTVAVIGLVNDESLNVQVIEEDYDDVTVGETRLTMFHVIPDSPPVTIVADDNVLTAGLAFPGTQGENDGVAVVDGVLAGSYDMQVYLTDTPDRILFDLPETELIQGRNYFIAAAGTLDSPELVLVSTTPSNVEPIPIMDEPPTSDVARLRVAHLSEDAPAVDVYIDGEISDFAGIAYPAASEWVAVPAGTYAVAVAPTETSIEEAVIGPVDLELQAGEWYTVAALGSVADESLSAQVLVEDYSDLPEDEARFTLVHAVPDAPPVDVYFNGDPLAESLEFGVMQGDDDGTVSFTVASGNYDIQVTPADDAQTVLLDIPGLSMNAGDHHLIAVVNSLDNLDAFVAVTDAERIAEFMD